MSKNFKKLTKVLSFLLSVLLILETGQMSLIAFAEEKAANVPQDTPVISNAIQDKENVEAEILYEIEEKRDEYTKVYKKSDGTNTAMVSSKPLHYENDGVWVDINNALERLYRNGQAVYTNTDNPVNIEFPETLNSNNSIVIQNGEYSLSFNMEGIQNSTINISETSENLSDDDNVDLNTKSETAVYSNVLPNTNLEYSIISKNIKENIIIQDVSSVQAVYSFKINAENLTGSCGEDGSVSFFDEYNEEIFTIPSPFMKDAANNISTDIIVSFSLAEEGQYILEYTPSQEWLTNETREYPIIIDPIIALASSDILSICSITDEDPDGNFFNDSYGLVTNGLYYENDEIHNENLVAETLVNINYEQIPFLSEHITPIDVQLLLGGAAVNIAAYEALEVWDATTVTYNTKPLCSVSPVDYFAGHMDYDNFEVINFNITKLFWQWFNGQKTNNGLYIKEYNHAEPAIGFFINEAILYVDYIENGGYDSRYDYHSQDVCRAGTSYINDFTQTLFLQRDDIGIDGNIMPVSISFFYNSAILSKVKDIISTELALNDETTLDSIPEVYGNDWLCNYNRCIFEMNNGIYDEICYATDTGTIITFISEENETDEITYKEENSEIIGSSGYSLIYNDEETNYSPYTIIRPDGLFEKFDNNGRLVKIYKESYPDQSIDIVYVSDLSNDNNYFAINKIIDGTGREYRFTYNATTNLLTKIKAYNSSGNEILAGSSSSTALRMLYDYDGNGNMKEAKFPDNCCAYYEYGNDNRLTVANSRNMYKLVYAYNNIGRIIQVSERGQDFGSIDGYINGNYINISNDGPRKVMFCDGTGAIESKQFDAHGMTSLITDEKGNFLSADYGVWQTEGENLLSNHSFEDGLTNWEHESINVFDVVNREAFGGCKALKLEGDNSIASVWQSIAISESGTYTFSAYIKAEDAIEPDDIMTMSLTAYDSNDEIITKNDRFIAALQTEYKRYSVVLNVPEGASYLTVGIDGSETNNTFYIDCVQLERGSGEGAYNILENGNFQSISNGTVIGFNSNNPYSVNTETVNTLQRNIVTFAASKTNDYTFSKTVSVNGNAGDVLVLGGWIKSDIVSNSTENTRLDDLLDTHNGLTNDRHCGLTISYNYTVVENGEETERTETVRKSVNDFISDWQYLANCITLKGECSEVTISFEHIKHPEAASVTNLTLSKEISYYEFDETDEAEETYEPTYCICGEDCEFGEGCPCLCLDANTCDCITCHNTIIPASTGCACSTCTRLDCTCECVNEEICECPQCKKAFDIVYDDFGNLMSLEISGYDTSEYLSMLTSRTFSASGNYMTNSTNENGNTTSYSYNENNGSLDSVTDARGNITQYTYNSMGALTQVKTPVSGLKKELQTQPKSMTTNYSYTNDLVTRIQHNNFSYYIDYDQWNNVDKVYSDAYNAALGVEVADYTYGTGMNRSRLEAIRYGNGGTVNYRYDEYNRVTGISYDRGNTWRYEYSYDTYGNVTMTKDNLSGHVVYIHEDVATVYSSTGNLLYASLYDNDGNFIEVVGGIVNITKPAESSRDYETGITTKVQDISTETNTVTLKSLTDAFGRTKQKSISVSPVENSGSNTVYSSNITTNYIYKNTGTNAGSKIDTILSEVLNGDTVTGNYGFSYDYDENGNITHEYSANADGTRGTLRYRYTYDEANQLKRVDDNIQSKTYTYKYDKGGNRVSEKVYNYTLSDSLGTKQSEIVSTYGYSVWNDRISRYDGNLISYDSAGNPTSYDGKTLVWNGKQLKSITAADGSRTEYEYDANGLRVLKKQYDENNMLSYYVEYLWQDDKITTQYFTLMLYVTRNNVTTEYPIGPIASKIFYDESGNPQGFSFYGETVFTFVRNLQGDVIAVVNSEGNPVIEYSYDPWGNIEYHFVDDSIAEDSETAMMFTALCPLTYRGYNYDFTTGLYYLQSRYYNPEWGRFINCDDTNILLATQGEIHGANLFAYCDNNPINKVDYDGKKANKDEDMLCKILDLISPFVSEKYFHIVKNSDKTITFSLKTSYKDFYTAMKKSCKLNSETTYLIVTLIANGLIKSKANRYFLFSIDCMCYEIKFHFELYKISKGTPGNQQVVTDPTASIGIGTANGLYLLGAYLDKHCKDCDIAEYEVSKEDQAIAFNYKNGIRSVYLNTPADPYYKNGRRQSYSVVPKQYTQWKNHLKKYGYIRDGVI